MSIFLKLLCTCKIISIPRTLYYMLVSVKKPCKSILLIENRIFKIIFWKQKGILNKHQHSVHMGKLISVNLWLISVNLVLISIISTNYFNSGEPESTIESVCVRKKFLCEPEFCDPSHACWCINEIHLFADRHWKLRRSVGSFFKVGNFLNSSVNV